MKVLTIKNPWAELIINGYKKYEFRSWKTKYRGKILIHTSINSDKQNINNFENLNLEYLNGHIIGEAEIVDCIELNKDFEDKLIKENKQIYGIVANRSGYAWKLENVVKYDKPIPIKGRLGLWEYN